MASRKRLQYQVQTGPLFIPSVPDTAVPSTNSTDTFFLEERQYQISAWTPPPPVIFEDKWHQPWSVPVRTRIAAAAIALIASGLFAPPVQPPAPAPGTPGTGLVVPTTDSVGVLFKERRQYQAYTAPVSVPSGTGTGFVVPTTDNVQVQFTVKHQYQAYTAPVTVTTETITVDKWFAPWREPVRQRPGLGVALQQAAPAVFGPPVVSFAYFNGLSEPVRQKPGLGAGLQQVIPAVFSPPVVSFSYYNWLSEPVRQKPGLAAYLQQSLAFQPIVVTEVITPDKWIYPWSDPVRLSRFQTALQQAVAFQPIVAADITNYRWLASWQDPVRQKPGLGPQLQQAFTTAIFQPTAPTPGTPGTGLVTPVMDSVGVLFKERRQYQALAYPVFVTPAAPGTGFVVPTTDNVPVQFRVLHQYQAYAAPVTTPTAEVITVDKWFAPWREPVRTRLFPTSEQQFLALDTAVIPVSKLETWNYPWSEPVRVRPQLLAGLQHFVPLVFRPPIVSFAYFNWLTEPVRQKPGLLAALQTAAIGPVLNPNTQITQNFESRWHYAWSEPVRKKPGLGAHLQEFFTRPPAIVAQTPITGTLFATEQGDLFFAFGAFFNQVENALVGIQFDRPLNSALVGIQFDMPLDSGNVGTAAANPSAQSGSASSPVVSANVAIRTV